MNEITSETRAPAPVPEVKKWQVDPGDPAGKIQCKRFNDAWRSLTSEHNHFIEKVGVIGGVEHESAYYSPFEVENRLEVTAACAGVGEAYGWTVSRKNVGNVVASIESELPALAASRPVHDKRRTPEADDLRKAEAAKATAEHEEAGKKQQAGFLAAFSNGPDKVTIQPGYMAVVAELNYDDSDGMTDYYAPHRGIGPEFLLAVVLEGREDESKLRQAVARYRFFDGIPFDWKTEKYSMGHGNYLEATGGWEELTPELAGSDRYYYCGGQVKSAGWEITYCKTYSKPVEMYAFKGWPGIMAAAPVSSESNDSQAGTVATVSENKAKGGIELRFPEKPAAAVLDNLKAHGWRWSRFSSCWYKTASDEARAFAQRLAGINGQGQSEKPASEPAASSAGGSGESTDPAGAYVQAQEEAYCDNQAAMCGA